MGKRKLAGFELYSGRRACEHGPAFDLRVALAEESEIPHFDMKEHVLEMRRTKMRKTYIFRAWQIDFSTVETTYPDQAGGGEKRAAKLSHEVELELDNYQLAQNLRAKAAGNPQHKLWELLSDFLFMARDLAALASEMTPLALPPSLMPPGPELISEEAKEAYRSRFNDTLPEPIVGHYLYRLAQAPAATVPRNDAISSSGPISE